MTTSMSRCKICVWNLSSCRLDLSALHPLTDSIVEPHYSRSPLRPNYLWEQTNSVTNPPSRSKESKCFAFLLRLRRLQFPKTIDILREQRKCRFLRFGGEEFLIDWIVASYSNFLRTSGTSTFERKFSFNARAASWFVESGITRRGRIAYSLLQFTKYKLSWNRSIPYPEWFDASTRAVLFHYSPIHITDIACSVHTTPFHRPANSVVECNTNPSLRSIVESLQIQRQQPLSFAAKTNIAWGWTMVYGVEWPISLLLKEIGMVKGLKRRLEQYSLRWLGMTKGKEVENAEEGRGGKKGENAAFSRDDWIPNEEAREAGSELESQSIESMAAIQERHWQRSLIEETVGDRQKELAFLRRKKAVILSLGELSHKLLREIESQQTNQRSDRKSNSRDEREGEKVKSGKQELLRCRTLSCSNSHSWKTGNADNDLVESDNCVLWWTNG